MSKGTRTVLRGGGDGNVAPLTRPQRRGRTYGTILVNLETHAVIDLLPDRTADTLALWLGRHPEVEVAVRDRAGAYAEGLRRGAPQAVQVADRFHLRKNASDALDRYLTRQYAAVRQAEHGDTAGDDGAAARPRDETVPATAAQAERRVRRLARYEEVIALRAAGASGRTIAARVGLGQRTVQRWLQAGHFPERQRRREQPGQAAPFAPYLRDRWAQGCHHATQLYRELRGRGYTGCYGSGAALVAPWRGPRYRHRGRLKVRRSPSDQSTYTPRRICWLLLRPTKALTDDERAYLARLYRACPQVAVAEALVEEFAAVLRERDVEGLYRWLRGAEASGIAEMQALARTIWLDQAAVEAAVRLDWSSGQVEGSVNKLKLRKREMYGRGKLDLLRRRLLAVA